MLLCNENAISSGNYQIKNSLRFQSASSQYLSRTPASAGNRQIWTWSAWVKRGTITAGNTLLAGGTVASTNYSSIFFNSTSNVIQVNNAVSGTGTVVVATNAVFRDPSAWYHIVVAVDTTQASGTNGIKIYINGIQQTTTVTTWTQNTNFSINNNVDNRLGVLSGGTEYFDGYMTEINFVNAQQLTPSSFGTTDATSGQWVAKKYTGTYGTNGFYLPFSNGTSTTTLGADSSGNGNNWTLTNFTRSAGVSDCWMMDVPSGNGSPSATQPSSNYCVWNPLQIGIATLSAANQTVTISNAADQQTRSTIAIPAGSGAYYCEVTVTTVGGADPIIGIAKWDNVALSTYLGANSTTYGYTRAGTKINNNTNTAYGATWTAGDVIGIALDNVNGNLTFYKNGVSQGLAFSSLQADMWMIALSGKGGFVASLNCGQRSFAYTPPSGFKALCTANLPVATILKGSNNMNAVLQVGSAVNTGANLFAQSGYTYGMAWGKDRAAVNNNQLVDTVRGTSNVLQSNTTAAETTYTAPTSGNNCVAWVWNAGNASSSNTSGSITSTVSVNATAGFSVVTYTGTGVLTTVGHGLGVAPKMIIVKPRSTTGDWIVYTSTTGSGNYLLLDTTAASAASTTKWNNTAPTSSVFSVGIDSTTNFLTTTYVAYCFAEIAGFSKFGSYTGNGSTDGPFVYTGFQPKFIMIKGATSSAVSTDDYWWMYDTVRGTYNVVGPALGANSSGAEVSFADLDILSNGFKLRTGSNGKNYNGQTIIFMAFATNPFAQSNAR